MNPNPKILAVILIILVAAIVAIAYQQIFQETPTTSIETTEKPPQTGCASLALDKRIYKQGEQVKITLENKCSYPIRLKNSAPWKIVTKSGKEVFTPVALQVITEVKPRKSKTWVWNQRDNLGKQVKPGTYQIILETMNAGILVQSFTITTT